MVFSNNPDIQQLQKVVSAIDEGLFQNSGITQLGEHHHEDSSLERHKEIIHRESYHAAGGIAPDSSGELQVMVQGEEMTCDSLSTVPNSFMFDQNPRLESHQSKEIYSPSIAPDTPSIDPPPLHSITKSVEVSSDRPSVAKRLFRTGACGFVITVIVGGAFIWRSSDDTTKETANGWINSLVWSSPLLPNNLHQRQAPGLQQQLETIVGDLTIVRRIVEQVAARQDQMAQDIATLQAAEQNVSQKISMPPSVSGLPHPATQKK
jgi:hypothetical protein